MTAVRTTPPPRLPTRSRSDGRDRAWCGVSPMLTRLAAERATGVLVREGGSLHLADGLVVHAQSPSAPGLGILLTAHGVLTADDWSAAVAATGDPARAGRHLVDAGRLTPGALELCQLSALYDAAYFALSPSRTPGRFRYATPEDPPGPAEPAEPADATGIPRPPGTSLPTGTPHQAGTPHPAATAGTAGTAEIAATTGRPGTADTGAAAATDGTGGGSSPATGTTATPGAPTGQGPTPGTGAPPGTYTGTGAVTASPASIMFRPLPVAALERETYRRRALLHRIWPDPRPDEAPLVVSTRTAAPALTRRQRTLLDRVDGVRTATDLARELGRLAFHTLVDVRRLTAAGVIDPGRMPAPPPVGHPYEDVVPAPPPRPELLSSDPHITLLKRLRDALEAL
ncbi:hypothetical protein ELQ87_23110 [Streptomyces griseoviridis]|uniref:Transcriptional regulator n=1 Tax=Streptomyces griseoviridis TaxID=45398 RepID=A0A3Q9KVD3_STRGD|nr:hypothetical protein [Streptomyces griseoviridis]AZS86823.1 hypothetical protein ELQ87_23110 [Streptomyces griseoviridis]QCN86320.1 hypothetical protein DDJ31_16155 [Streptomyces griseoviridis]